MGSQDKPTTRRYTVEQKDQAVRLVRKTDPAGIHVGVVSGGVDQGNSA